jgi:hypothetical protein
MFSFKGGADGTIAWPFSSIIAIGANISEGNCGPGALIQHRLLSEPAALPIAINKDRGFLLRRKSMTKPMAFTARAIMKKI